MTKTVTVTPAALALCSVKAETADKLTLDELRDLISWCDWQAADLWEDMSLQEILNVYRASAEYTTWEGWAVENWRAAYKAWNAAVIDPGNKMKPRAA